MNIRKTNKRRTSDYKEFLLKRLRNPSMAAGYLTAALQEGDDVFLLAIRDVAEANGGIAPLAQKTKLNREGLYDMLSKNGNPRFSSLSSVIDALGIQLRFTPKLQDKKAA
jgi:probable addiction module antidote protein